jgi:hypothetical protein
MSQNTTSAQVAVTACWPETYVNEAQITSSPGRMPAVGWEPGIADLALVLG